MSDAHADHDLPHEGPIKTPKQLILAVIFSFVIAGVSQMFVSILSDFKQQSRIAVTNIH